MLVKGATDISELMAYLGFWCQDVLRYVDVHKWKLDGSTKSYKMVP